MTFHSVATWEVLFALVATPITALWIARRLPLQNVVTIVVLGIGFPTSIAALLPRLASDAPENTSALIGVATFFLITNARGIAEHFLAPWRHQPAYGWKLMGLAAALASSLAVLRRDELSRFPIWMIACLTAATHLVQAPWFIDKRRVNISLNRIPFALWSTAIALAVITSDLHSEWLPKATILGFHLIFLPCAWVHSRPQIKPLSPAPPIC